MAGIGSAAFADPNGAQAQRFDAQQRMPQDQQPRDIGGEPQPNASPEEQAAYEQFVRNGLEMIYPSSAQGQVAPQILKDLAGQFDQQVMQMFAQADPPIQQNPVDNLAVTTVMVILMLEGSAAQAGQQIDQDMEYQAGSELMGELATVAQAASIHDYSDKEMEGSWYRAVDLWRQVSPSADQEQLSSQFGQVVQADREGRLADVIGEDAIRHGSASDEDGDEAQSKGPSDQDGDEPGRRMR